MSNSRSVTICTCAGNDKADVTFFERLGTDVQQAIKVKQLFAHEGFSMDHLRNDIALFQLDRLVKLSDKVNTVYLPVQGSRIPDGYKCYITGECQFSDKEIKNAPSV